MYFTHLRSTQTVLVLYQLIHSSFVKDEILKNDKLEYNTNKFKKDHLVMHQN